MRVAFLYGLINIVYTNDRIFISKEDLWNLFDTAKFEEIINNIDALIAENYVIYFQDHELLYQNYTNVITADIAAITEYEE